MKADVNHTITTFTMTIPSQRTKAGIYTSRSESARGSYQGYTGLEGRADSRHRKRPTNLRQGGMTTTDSDLAQFILVGGNHSHEEVAQAAPEGQLQGDFGR